MTNSSSFFIKLALILFLANLPVLVYLIIFPKIQQRWEVALRRARRLAFANNSNHFSNHCYGDRGVEPERYFIGDISCRYNAHSPYLRCAVNPHGSCEQCSYYEQN